MRKSIARTLQARHHNRLNAHRVKPTEVNVDDPTVNSSKNTTTSASSSVSGEKKTDGTTGKNIIKRISTIASKKHREQLAATVNTATVNTATVNTATVNTAVAVDSVNVEIDSSMVAVDGSVDGSVDEAGDNKKKKVALCCVNNVPNVLQYTKKQIERMIITPLTEKYNTDIFMLNHTIDNSQNVSFNNANIYELNLEQLKTDTSELLKKSLKSDYQKCLIDAYMEKKIYSIIKESEKTNDTQYDAIVFIKSDIFPARKISIKEVSKAIENNNSFYSSSFNDWNGYGLGYYIGTSISLNVIFDRFNHMISDRHSAEKMLKTLVEKSNIKRIASNMFYFKIQKNGETDVYYQLLRKYTSNQEYMDAQKAYQSVLTKSQHKIRESLDIEDMSSRNKSKGANRRKHKRRSCAH
jgi:hypothetical protein